MKLEFFREFFTGYGYELAYFSMVLLFWPMGQSGFFIIYALTYWLSNREGSYNRLWTYVNFILLILVVRYLNDKYRSILLLRDLALISFVQYKLRNEAFPTVKNPSTEAKCFLCLINMIVLILSAYENILTTYAYGLVPGGEIAPYMINFVLITLDMLHLNLESFFDVKHRDRLSYLLSYLLLFIKAALVLNATKTVSILQCVTFFMLDLMSCSNTTGIHAISFKLLSITYMVSAFLV